MLHLFEERGNIFWFPAKWANSVTRWLLNLTCKDGSIEISNTSEPTESEGCDLRVNVDVIYDEIKDRIIDDIMKKLEEQEQEQEEEEEELTGLGKYCVKPTFNESGVLTALQFGTDAELDALSGDNPPVNIPIVTTQIGCPYNAQS